ncbi:hypothetical protein [Deinococcus fonticola]|uniref:hypothetical protein n=1 Tax=Deinococcus fonticola TaxID=2528713 RepID=UPI0010757FB4|nr:hypothetical protein [Deinococcus fonticola]
MRYLIPILLLLAAAWYFTTGFRVGVVTFTPTTMINANGKATYNLRSFEERKQVGLIGTCTVKSGLATVRLLRPDGTQADGKECPPGGPWSITVQDKGISGNYRAVIEYRNFNGKIELNELPPGK